jgi:hypothetical protein
VGPEIPRENARPPYVTIFGIPTTLNIPCSGTIPQHPANADFGLPHPLTSLWSTAAAVLQYTTPTGRADTQQSDTEKPDDKPARDASSRPAGCPHVSGRGSLRHPCGREVANTWELCSTHIGSLDGFGPPTRQAVSSCAEQTRLPTDVMQRGKSGNTSNGKKSPPQGRRGSRGAHDSKVGKAPAGIKEMSCFPHLTPHLTAYDRRTLWPKRRNVLAGKGVIVADLTPRWPPLKHSGTRETRSWFSPSQFRRQVRAHSVFSSFLRFGTRATM